MSDPFPFKWRHFEADIILCAVRCYLRYALSYRDVEELLQQRGVSVDHTTVLRWVQRYAPELDRRGRPYLHATNDSYRVDETYIRINKHWYYLDRAVDSAGAALDFMLSPIRDADAAERFFRKILQASHTLTPPCDHCRQPRRVAARLRGPSAGGNAFRDLSAQTVHISEQYSGTGSSVGEVPRQPWVGVWGIRYGPVDQPRL